jgi:Putative prokaryotic signal transducing protein
MNDENLVTIRTYKDHIVADIMVATLHNAGIDTFVTNESQTMLPLENVEIKVKESDVEQALEIIEEQEAL